MGECPFCGDKISEETLMYGGSCPKCFAEIPGEEAATDPGEVVKAQQDRSDNRRRAVKTLIPFLLTIPMIGFLAFLALAFMIYNRDPFVETMVFDDIEEFDYAIVSAPDPEPEPVASNTPVKPGPRPVGGTKVAPKPEVDAMGIPIVKAEKATGGLSFEGIGVTASRSSGQILKEPEAIRKMIGQQMRKYGGQLKLCYDKRLKTRTDLQGRWKAKFVINKNGYAEKISFTGVTMKDAEMEACMATTVKRWKFSKIVRPQPVEKNWRFRR